MERALQLWPGVHGQVLCDEIRYGFALLPWLGSTSRTVRLIDHILDQPERSCGVETGSSAINTKGQQ